MKRLPSTSLGNFTVNDPNELTGSSRSGMYTASDGTDVKPSSVKVKVNMAEALLNQLQELWHDHCDGSGGPACEPEPVICPTGDRKPALITPEQVAVEAAVGVGAYVTYRCIRMLASWLIPALWPTIPVNAAAP